MRASRRPLVQASFPWARPRVGWEKLLCAPASVRIDGKRARAGDRLSTGKNIASRRSRNGRAGRLGDAAAASARSDLAALRGRRALRDDDVI